MIPPQNPNILVVGRVVYVGLKVESVYFWPRKQRLTNLHHKVDDFYEIKWLL